MNAWKRIAAAALGALLLVPATTAAGYKRPRPPDVPAAETSIAPHGFQIYNDYASPERTYSSQRVVVHYVVLGIDAPPLNDDNADGVPDTSSASARRGTRRSRTSSAVGSGLRGRTIAADGRPDIYVSRFSPGTLGVSIPAVEAEGGAFAVVANNLDPSAERSFASVYGTVAHELFHLTQFSYFRPNGDPAIPTWILEGTAAAMESRVCPARRPRLHDPAASLVLGDAGEHHDAELRRPAAVAATRRPAAAASAHLARPPGGATGLRRGRAPGGLDLRQRGS